METINETALTSQAPLPNQRDRGGRLEAPTYKPATLSMDDRRRDRMIKVEFEEPGEEKCDCCGGITTRLTRFVYKDGDAFAVYYAAFSDNHPDKEIKVAIGMGEWGEEASPEDRRSFALTIRDGGAQYEVIVVDANESPWHDATFIGRMLNRDEALKHPWMSLAL